VVTPPTTANSSSGRLWKNMKSAVLIETRMPV
jgi:hypothetical protein